MSYWSAGSIPLTPALNAGIQSPGLRRWMESKRSTHRLWWYRCLPGRGWGTLIIARQLWHQMLPQTLRLCHCSSHLMICDQRWHHWWRMPVDRQRWVRHSESASHWDVQSGGSGDSSEASAVSLAAVHDLSLDPTVLTVISNKDSCWRSPILIA